VSVSTTGPEPDPDGYLITVDAALTQPVQTNGTVRFESLPSGTHIVAIGGNTPACLPSQPAQSVILAGAPVTLKFSVTCVRPLRDRLAFSRDGVIYLMNSDGSGQSSLGPGFRPSVSPDGLSIAFLRDRGDGLLKIHLMRADGTDEHAITPCPGTVCDWQDVAWRPTGSELAASTFFIPEGCILALSPDGEFIRQLTPPCGGWDNRDPAWSWDGAKLAFASNRGGNYEIYVVDADGSNTVQLTTNGVREERPAWRPDGLKLAFVSDRDGNREIYVINADGTGATRLTNHPADDGEPVWAPDGAHLAFTTDRDGNREIYVMNADGSGLVNLSRNPAQDSSPDWSRVP
jgi:TolB protein